MSWWWFNFLAAFTIRVYVLSVLGIPSDTRTHRVPPPNTAFRELCNSIPFEDSNQKHLNNLIEDRESHFGWWVQINFNWLPQCVLLFFSLFVCFVLFFICICSLSIFTHGTAEHTRAQFLIILKYIIYIRFKVYIDVWGLLSPAVSTLKHKRWTEICLNYIDRFKANHAISKLHQFRWAFYSIKRDVGCEWGWWQRRS